VGGRAELEGIREGGRGRREECVGMSGNHVISIDNRNNIQF